ncbi:MAG: dipeptide ABC transporter ATP-binding protein [Gammaproteobacteria bacterium]|nr:dipeptide ABC transporter ATP-binding protein [Gammaproteobacteria bacterium]
MQPLLSINELELSIGGNVILSDLSLHIHSGEVLGIIGESGSGKSMLALSVLRLTPEPSTVSGDIEFDGERLDALSEQAMCEVRGNHISMIFQEPMTALNPVQTIGHQVAECIELHSNMSRGNAWSIACETLEKVGLPNSQFSPYRYPHELSGGQRQRVVIAMAIALKPKLLIADEPTTALDVTTQAEILNLLKELQKSEGMALILISHDLAVVADTADRIIIMRNGEIVDRGDIPEVFQTINHPYTKTLFESSSHVPSDHGKAISEESLLEVRGLTCDYPLPRKLFRAQQFFRAVDDVDLDIKKGQSVGLVGESGCGKSTLTRALLGLAPVSGGSVRLNGQVISGLEELSKSTRRQMQVVFQDPYGSFNPRHRVARLVAEPLHVLPTPPVGRDRDRLVIESLEAVGLAADDAQKYIHEFSGGQRQRIAIARALIIKPALIILDEAVSALDVSVRASILDLLAKLAADHALSYLFISHDLSVVRNVTDRVLVMRRGQIVERGATEEVFNSPSHDYTQALIAAAPSLPTQTKRS